MARPRVNKKQDILQAATGLFAAQGFDGTTTLQISKEAGITEPVIYYHFKGKDDLFTRIIITAFANFFRIWIPCRRKPRPSLKRSKT